MALGRRGCQQATERVEGKVERGRRQRSVGTRWRSAVSKQGFVKAEEARCGDGSQVAGGRPGCPGGSRGGNRGCGGCAGPAARKLATLLAQAAPEIAGDTPPRRHTHPAASAVMRCVRVHVRVWCACGARMRVRVQCGAHVCAGGGDPTGHLVTDAQRGALLWRYTHVCAGAAAASRAPRGGNQGRGGCSEAAAERRRPASARVVFAALQSVVKVPEPHLLGCGAGAARAPGQGQAQSRSQGQRRSRGVPASPCGRWHEPLLHAVASYVVCGYSLHHIRLQGSPSGRRRERRRVVCRHRPPCRPLSSRAPVMCMWCVRRPWLSREHA